MPKYDKHGNIFVRHCRYPGCEDEGHDRRTCAKRFREERASGNPIPWVRADNNEELRRIRTLTNTRRRVEREAVRAAAEARYPVVQQNPMQGWEEERQEEERLIQGFPEERQEEMRQGWEEERQEELRQIQAQALEGAAPQPDCVPNAIDLANRRHEPMETATENELARMVALPVLRETAVETTECPICIEELGEVGKTVLKCGHTVCLSCFLQQMMRATGATRARDCACPLCRVNYIM
jgi:hypothetical protein